MNYSEKIKKRLESNEEILKLLGILVKTFPDQRFGQIIANYVFPDYRHHDIFFDESADTLEDLRKLLQPDEGEEEKENDI